MKITIKSCLKRGIQNMEIALQMDFMEDKNLKLNIEKVGQEFCNPQKKATNCLRPCYALHFVLFGKGSLIDGNGKRYELGKNDAFLLYKDEKYSYFPNEQDPWFYIWVGFSGAGIDEFVSLCGFEKDNIKKHIVDFNDYVTLMRNMYDCFDASEVQSLRCTAYLLLIFGEFIEREIAA